MAAALDVGAGRRPPRRIAFRWARRPFPARAGLIRVSPFGEAESLPARPPRKLAIMAIFTPAAPADVGAPPSLPG